MLGMARALGRNRRAVAGLFIWPRGRYRLDPHWTPMGQIIAALHVPDHTPPARAQFARFRTRPPYLDRRALRPVRPDAGAVSHGPTTPGHL